MTGPRVYGDALGRLLLDRVVEARERRIDGIVAEAEARRAGFDARADFEAATRALHGLAPRGPEGV